MLHFFQRSCKQCVLALSTYQGQGQELLNCGAKKSSTLRDLHGRSDLQSLVCSSCELVFDDKAEIKPLDDEQVNKKHCQVEVQEKYFWTSVSKYNNIS